MPEPRDPAVGETEVPVQPASPSATPEAELRTFLIADIRGYTTYTREHGDEAGAALASRFAELVAEVVARATAASSSSVAMRRSSFSYRPGRPCGPRSTCRPDSWRPRCRAASGSASMPARPSRSETATAEPPSTLRPDCARRRGRRDARLRSGDPPGGQAGWDRVRRRARRQAQGIPRVGPGRGRHAVRAGQGPPSSGDGARGPGPGTLRGPRVAGVGIAVLDRRWVAGCSARRTGDASPSGAPSARPTRSPAPAFRSWRSMTQHRRPQGDDPADVAAKHRVLLRRVVLGPGRKPQGVQPGRPGERRGRPIHSRPRGRGEWLQHRRTSIWVTDLAGPHVIRIDKRTGSSPISRSGRMSSTGRSRPTWRSAVVRYGWRGRTFPRSPVSTRSRARSRRGWTWMPGVTFGDGGLWYWREGWIGHIDEVTNEETFDPLHSVVRHVAREHLRRRG